MDSPAPAPPGASCATHAAAPAAVICSRCGAFMCAACLGDDAAGLCPTCRATHGFDVQKLAGAYRALVLWFGAQVLVWVAQSVIQDSQLEVFFRLATLVTLLALA